MVPEHYSMDALRRAIRNPTLFKLEAIRWALDFNKRFYGRFGHDETDDFLAEEWDTLLLLDACRYDMFAERASLPGRLERRYSPGSDSWEFMSATFLDRTLHDTVYVTANPHVEMLPEGTFHAVVNLLEDHWDEQHRTVMPEVVAEAVLDARETYPDKRLIGHFMQPHFPFVGETGEQLPHMGVEMHLDEDEQRLNENPWFDLVYGDVPVADVVRAYRENLDVVLPEVERLIEALSGQTVVSADHANLVGERTWPVPIRTFGHPRGLHKRELLEVPWLVVEGERRDHVAEPPVERGTVDEDVVEDRLADLGYV